MRVERVRVGLDRLLVIGLDLRRILGVARDPRQGQKPARRIDSTDVPGDLLGLFLPPPMMPGALMEKMSSSMCASTLRGSSCTAFSASL